MMTSFKRLLTVFSCALVLTSCGNTVEELQLDQESKEPVLFDTVLKGSSSRLGVVFDAPPDTLVGQKVPIQAQIQFSPDFFSEEDPDGSGRMLEDGFRFRWRLYSPSSVVSGSTPFRQLALGETFTIRSSDIFTCAKPGTADLILNMQVEYAHVTRFTKGIFGGISDMSISTQLDNYDANSPSFECLPSAESEEEDDDSRDLEEEEDVPEEAPRLVSLPPPLSAACPECEDLEEAYRATLSELRALTDPEALDSVADNVFRDSQEAADVRSAEKHLEIVTSTLEDAHAAPESIRSLMIEEAQESIDQAARELDQALVTLQERVDEERQSFRDYIEDTHARAQEERLALHDCNTLLCTDGDVQDDDDSRDPEEDDEGAEEAEESEEGKDGESEEDTGDQDEGNVALGFDFLKKTADNLDEFIEMGRGDIQSLQTVSIPALSVIANGESVVIPYPYRELTLSPPAHQGAFRCDSSHFVGSATAIDLRIVVPPEGGCGWGSESFVGTLTVDSSLFVEWLEFQDYFPDIPSDAQFEDDLKELEALGEGTSHPTSTSADEATVPKDTPLLKTCTIVNSVPVCK